MKIQDTRTFLEDAENRLAGIRGSLLLFAQGRLERAEIIPLCRKLAQFQLDAEGSGLVHAGRLAAEAAYSIEHLSHTDESRRDAAANRSLDLVAKLEAELLNIPLASGEFLDDVNALLDSSFDGLIGEEPIPAALEEFEIDEETLEIFREEGDSLIASITASLETLRQDPADSNALWEIRRCAHTFKGAAGIVGLGHASALAHVVEDLLDRMVNRGEPASERVIAAVASAVAGLTAMISAREPSADPKVVAELIAIRDDAESAPQEQAQPAQTAQPIHTPPTPVVRVSLERLDELMELSARLTADNESLARHFADGSNSEGISSLLNAQRDLCDAISHGLQQIRMVRFGVLEMRLNRTVNVTCQDEGKSAVVEILNPDVEVDTLVIDALIEPLLHLLKNAVVHGIERPETRRLVGKPEKGLIKIGVAADVRNVILTVEDDGRGISTAKLIDKAVAAGILSADAADGLSSQDACQLIFERGLTTAGSLNMNAGRGVGMSIVRESVESRGGSVVITSEPQQGTAFALTFPIHPVVPEQEITETEDDFSPLVLVVDDSNSVRSMTARIVEGTGCRVVTAVNGAEALELLLSGTVSPDLILSDVEMPVMDGWQLLEYLKTDEHHSHIPVVMVTSLNSAEYREKAARLGAADYLVKPISLDDFETVVAPIILTVKS